MRLNNIGYLLKEGVKGIFSHGFQNSLEPDIIFPAHTEKQVCVLNCQDILRRRLVGVNLFAGPEQHADLCLSS